MWSQPAGRRGYSPLPIDRRRLGDSAVNARFGLSFCRFGQTVEARLPSRQVAKRASAGAMTHRAARACVTPCGASWRGSKLAGSRPSSACDHWSIVSRRGVARFTASRHKHSGCDRRGVALSPHRSTVALSGAGRPRFAPLHRSLCRTFRRSLSSLRARWHIAPMLHSASRGTEWRGVIEGGDA